MEQHLKPLDEPFTKVYSSMERSSIPRERLLKAVKFKLIYSIKGERTLIEYIDFNLTESRIEGSQAHEIPHEMRGNLRTLISI